MANTINFIEAHEKAQRELRPKAGPQEMARMREAIGHKAYAAYNKAGMPDGLLTSHSVAIKIFADEIGVDLTKLPLL